MTSSDLRRSYIDFFVERHGHTFVPSSPVVPADDPTLLFTNAGMNQFKPIFLGSERRPYTRAANTQKCIRAGGKHNDLDDVGRSRRHHTFFEMLGNWSFGDYFKAGAIEYAWELLTKVWGLDPTRLHVTCYEGDPASGVPRDTEAADLWKKIAGVPADRLHWGGKDNFWEMGETGPCGPCTEVFVDRTPDKTGGPTVLTGTDPRVMEVWNLVFIQFNRNADRSLTPLPAQHVDTGMGFERIAQVIQGKSDNYATDLWRPLFGAIGDLAKAEYGGRFPKSDTDRDPAELQDRALQRDVAFRVVADHARMATFAITDGAKPDNKGRDSVVRSVVRRAVRFGYQQFDLREPFLHKLTAVVADTMGDAFPEVRANAARVAGLIETEERSFLETIDRGLGIFTDAAARAADGRVSGRDAFDLHTTYGFPIDLTTQMASERGLAVDRAEYDKRFEQFQTESGKGRKKAGASATDLTKFPPTDDAPKYGPGPVTAKIVGLVVNDEPRASGTLGRGQQAYVLLDRTPFYAEQGGQVGDVGKIATDTGTFLVADTERRGAHVLHWGEVDTGTVEVGKSARAEVDARRADIVRNHTGTHLANFALRRVLGEHVEQKGSLVDDEKLRFDFAHDRALTGEQLAEVERLVNVQVALDVEVTATVMPLADARAIPGVRAVFGEKYPDPVRVVSVGTSNPGRDGAADYSVEFCGGTHAARTGQIGFFKIVEEASVSKGVRRITAVTGARAVAAAQKNDQLVAQLRGQLNATADDLPARVAALQDEVKQLKKKLASGGGTSAGGFDVKTLAADALAQLAADGFAVLDCGAATPEQLLSVSDSVRKQSPRYAVLLAGAQGDKVSFAASVSDDVIAAGLKAGDWVRSAAVAAGGNGGGRPNIAQAGAKDASKVPAALDAARAFARSKVSAVAAA